MGVLEMRCDMLVRRMTNGFRCVLPVCCKQSELENLCVLETDEKQS